MTKFLSLLLAAFAFALAFAACGDDGETTIRGDNGDVTLSEDLPDGFPDDFPIYDGADFVGGARSTEEGAIGIVATWETRDDAEDVIAFYEDELSGDGNWVEVSQTTSPDGVFIIFQHADDESRAGSVTVVREGDTTTIAVIIGESDDLIGDDGDDGDGSGSDGDDDGADDDGDDDGATGGADLPDEVELSDEFPSDRVPLPDGARVTNTSSLSTAATTTHFVEFYSETSTSDLRDYYEDELPGNGWTEVFTSTEGGEFFLSYADDTSTESLLITIGESEVEGYAIVSITVTLTEAA
jgi:hypothetical protein